MDVLYSQTDVLRVRQNKEITDSGDGSLALKKGLGSLLDCISTLDISNHVIVKTYSLQLVSSDAVKGFSDGGNVNGLATVEDTGASKVNALVTKLALGEGLELGVCDSLGNVFLANSAVGDALEGLDSLFGSLADGSGLAGQLNGEQTSVGVCEIRGRDRNTRQTSSGLG